MFPYSVEENICKEERLIFWNLTNYLWVPEYFDRFWECELNDGQIVSAIKLRKEFLRDFGFKYSDSLTIEKYSDVIDLEYFVQNCTKESIFCNNTKVDICLEKTEVCDGVAHCPDAEDEDLNKCSHTFAASANFICNKTDTSTDFKFLIRATPCDGVSECRNNEDEADCDDQILFVFLNLGLVGLAFFLVSLVLVISIWIRFKDTSIDGEFSEGTMELSIVVAMQASEARISFNTDFFQSVLQQHSMDLPHTLIYLKVSIMI